ncbi:MAG: UvrD-helicase domain-containing protein [Dissulfuribacterales bacterium]
MNNKKKPIADAAQREQALDPTQSFIVKAPAGSGKTELLIQRYLKLLSSVEAPEEIIAITFTRKASAEMKNRILKALERGAGPTPPVELHERRTWELAKNVLAQDTRKNWHMVQNPGRMKIQTIDSLCAGLTRQMPFLSKFGAQPQITDRPEALYREAAKNTLADLESAAKWRSAIEDLIRHLDNHLANIENLIAGMLAKRDQWLRHVADTTDGRQQRESLETALGDLITDALVKVRNRFNGHGMNQLLSLARYAAKNLKQDGSESKICECDGLKDLPGASPSEINKWLGLADLLLTQTGNWRKSATIHNGFPAPSGTTDKHLKQVYKENKETFNAYIAGFKAGDDTEAVLYRVRVLPPATYTDDQWRIMAALFEILKVATGHLELVFQAAGQVDFSEIALRAGQALGKPEDPTDLSLSLDYRISHILMDEFQDTSITQYELIERLTAGWVPGDGRTFFAVGDPMQSIYGFREAEVGLFLNAWETGLNQVVLKPLTLTVNFRSQEGIIDWVNEKFPKIMPDTGDITTGAVCYSASTAFHSPLTGQAVHVHPFIPADRDAEAMAVVDCVRKSKKNDPNNTIAILVRSRSHLEYIVPALKAAGLTFHAVEIDSLKNRPIITDLISLTRALSHPADRIAWLAVLRAPWCGLTLTDLYALVADDPDAASANLTNKTLLELMTDPIRCSGLSNDGQKRLAAVADVLRPAIENRDRKSLRRTVEGAWLALGGPACVFNEAEFDDVSVFLDLLDQQAQNSVMIDVKALEDAASLLFARPDPGADETLQIMTIHKAKGLEFDTVILPGLEKKPPPDPSQLLRWLERAKEGRRDLLLAPITETGVEKDKIYNYIQKIHDEKRAFEDARLVYVAATRAKKYLHLLGGVYVTKKNSEIRQPFGKSLLSKLWPAVSDRFYKMHHVLNPSAEKPDESEELPEPVEQIVVPYIRRFTKIPGSPDLPADVVLKSKPSLKFEVKTIVSMPEFDWAGETVRQVGIVLHRWFRVICEQGLSLWNTDRIEALAPVFKKDLIRSGIGTDTIEDALVTVKIALTTALSDDRGRWILADHKDGACEYALTGQIDNEIVSVKLDRTFIDEEGVRWIIDYKTGMHKGGSVDEFLDREQLRYQTQMETYAKLMRAKEDREVRLGLYFPQLKGWREL